MRGDRRDARRRRARLQRLLVGPWHQGDDATHLAVIDPPDGRVPELTEDAKKRAGEEGKRPAFRGAGANGRGTDTWLDCSTFERCITRGMPGAMSPTAYNNNYRITRVPDTLLFRSRCWVERA